MNTKSLRLFVLLTGLLLGSSSFLRADAPAKGDAVLATTLLMALEKGDYAAFIASGEDQFKQTPKAQFDAAVVKSAAKLKKPHVVVYLGDMKQNGYHVTLWKLTFKDGTDDALVMFNVKDGKVGGFNLL